MLKGYVQSDLSTIHSFVSDLSVRVLGVVGKPHDVFTIHSQFLHLLLIFFTGSDEMDDSSLCEVDARLEFEIGLLFRLQLGADRDDFVRFQSQSTLVLQQEIEVSRCSLVEHQLLHVALQILLVVSVKPLHHG